MNTIWKWVLTPECTIEMPSGAQVMSVGVQEDNICLWARVDTDKPLENRSFVSYGTGHPIPSPQIALHHIGMVALGSLVFHVFEDISK